MEGIGVDYFGDERIVHMRTSRLHSEIGSQSSGAACECEDSSCFAGEAFDFTPTVSWSGAVRFRPLRPRDHDLCGLGWGGTWFR
jgi:hypothetical protein